MVIKPEMFCIEKCIIIRDVARYVTSLDSKVYKLYHDNTIKNEDMKTLERIYNVDVIPKETRNVKVEVLRQKIVNRRKRIGYKKFITFEVMAYTIRKIITPNYWTEGCDNMDESGFCNGHGIKRQEFINEYCNGILPPQLDF